MSITTVSYTHLDVYKRQLLNGEVVQSAEDYDLPAEKGLVGIFERMKETDILTAVSYTHLDVYKRQPK